jgi:FkbM family methyltransferase
MKSRLKTLLRGSFLYTPARNAYLAVFNRAEHRRRRALERLFRHFIGPGDLVFDVGANVGDYTDVFLRLGARVVAVEPNPRCIDMLRARFPPERLTIENLAAGSREGSLELRLAQTSLLSTVSDEWIGAAAASPRFSRVRWDRSIRVPVTTLDALVARHGRPSFIKVDVEGFEEQALMGLSFVPGALSFEYNTEFLDPAKACVRRLARHAVEFNALVGESTRLVAKEWMNAERALAFLDQAATRERGTHGDVFVRRLA